MKFISYAENISQAETLIKNEIKEIIVSCKELSRFHQKRLEDLLALTKFILKNNAKPILEWDVLYTENNFQNALNIFQKLPLHDFAAIRVQDPGVLHLIKQKYSWLPIQLIVETGNHNLVALQKWEEYVGPQLERLVLSNELSKEHLKNYTKALKTPIEVLLFGRLLLFYSPRKLLSPIEKKELEYITASGTSEESPHSGFPIIENTHGTFMFNVKDLSLIDQVAELGEMGISFGRLDLRFDDSIEKIADLKNYKGPRPLVKGFYQINKTDVLFSKLKNKLTNRNDQNYLGVVVDVEREKGIAILVKAKDFKRTEKTQFKIITPEGKEKTLQRFSLHNSLNENVESVREGDIVICTYINGVTVKSQVYIE